MNHYVSLLIASLIVGTIACFIVNKFVDNDTAAPEPFSWRDACIVYCFCAIPAALMELIAWAAQYITNL